MSSFVGSILILTLYKSKNGEGELTIQTDNYSVLTIMKVSFIFFDLSYFLGPNNFASQLEIFAAKNRIRLQ